MASFITDEAPRLARLAAWSHLFVETEGALPEKLERLSRGTIAQMGELAEALHRAEAADSAGIFDELYQISQGDPSLARCSTLASIIMDDIQTAQRASPLTPASRGVNGGPIFLVGYSQHCVSKSYVLKWTRETEMQSQFIYRMFMFALQAVLPFRIPTAQMIDEDQLTYVDSEGHVTPIQPEDRDRLLLSLNTIRDCGNPGAQKKGEQLMIMSRVAGATFDDFIVAGRFNEMSEEAKQKTFQQIGQIAMLDLLLGNMDRFFNWKMMDSGFVNQNEANLGNVMVCEEETPVFYLIDNELKSGEFFLGLTEIAKKLQGSERQKELKRLADEIITNLHSAVAAAACNNAVPMEQVHLFYEALNDSHEWLIEGLDQMEQHLRRILPQWFDHQGPFSDRSMVDQEFDRDLTKRFRLFLDPNKYFQSSGPRYVPPQRRV